MVGFIVFAVVVHNNSAFGRNGKLGGRDGFDPCESVELQNISGYASPFMEFALQNPPDVCMYKEGNLIE